MEAAIYTPFELDSSLAAMNYNQPNVIKNTSQDLVDIVGNNNVYFYGNIVNDGAVLRIYNTGVSLKFVANDTDNSVSKATKFIGKHTGEFTVSKGNYVEMIGMKNPDDETRVMWLITNHF